MITILLVTPSDIGLIFITGKLTVNIKYTKRVSSTKSQHFVPPKVGPESLIE